MTTHTDALGAAAALFSALAHPGRLAILQSLHATPDQSVSELVSALGVEQSATSHQLRVLREARLVAARRDGRHIRYRLHDQHVAHIVEDGIAHAGEHTPAG